MSLQSKAILVSIKAPTFRNNRKDKQASAETCYANNASLDAGTFVKHLLPKEAYADYSNAVMAARLCHYKYSMPWLDQGGVRIMPTAVWSEFKAEIRTIEAKIDLARQAFFANYETYVQDQTRLGKLYNAADYPSRQALERKFVFQVIELPLPDTGDFRCDLDAADRAILEQTLTERIRQAEESANAANWQRLHKALSELREKLGRYSGTRQGAFRDTVTSELCELVDLLPRLNLAEDSNLDQTIRQVQDTICVHSPADLRDNETARQDVIDNADSILASMSGWIGDDDD